MARALGHTELVEPEAVRRHGPHNLALLTMTRATTHRIPRWQRLSLYTSGGLLLCVGRRFINDVLKLLKTRRTPCAAVIGRIVRSATVRIRVAGQGG